MATERVDKGWQQRELTEYSTAAILGTLAHYGISIDEAAFGALAETTYPVGIAQSWHPQWRGTGQFTHFYTAAAQMLWQRARPTDVSPADVALAVIQLVKSLNEAVGGQADDGTRDTRFKVVEQYLAKVPTSSPRREAFESEVMQLLGRWADGFDAMGEALAKKGLLAEANRFTSIEEALFLVRKGTARALVRAASGDEAGAKADLIALASDASAPVDVKVSVVDALLDLNQVPEAFGLLTALVELCPAGDIDFMVTLLERVKRLGPLLPKADSVALVEKLEALARVG